MRAACYDLETTNLYGNFIGIILAACIKPFPSEPGKETKVKVFRRDKYPGWKNNRSDDSRLALDIYKELSKYNIWIAHNGLCYDVNFLRTRLHEPGVRRKMPQPKIVDPVRLARRYLRMKYNSLEQVGEHLGLRTQKSKLSNKVWTRAALDGDRKSMNYIVDHCVRDVCLLEEIVEELDYLIPKVTKWGSDT